MTTTVRHVDPRMQRRGLFHGLFLSRFRSLLPFRAAIAMILIATACRYIPALRDYPGVVVPGLLCLGAIGVVGVRLLNVAHAENQLFGYIVIAVCVVWLLLIYLARPPFAFSAISLMVITAGFGLLYALDRRNSTVIKIQDKTRSWAENPERQENVGLKNTRWESYEETDFGWMGVMAWDGADNLVEDIIKRRRDLETEWHEYLDTLSIEPMKDQISGQVYSNKVCIRCVQTNPLAQIILWDGVTAESPMHYRPIAMYADAQVAQDRIWTPGIGGRHKLFAGASRSGKSVAMKHEIVTYGPCKDGSVVITLCDLKGGTSFMKYASMAAWTVTTPEDAVLQLEALALITVARGAYVASRRDWGEVWEPQAGFPIILSYFDEVSVLLDADADSGLRRRAVIAMKTIARMGMGLGVLLRLGVQEPTREAVGSMQILAQLVYRIGFRLQYMDRAKYCIPNLASKGVEPGNIPIDHNGECYIEDGILNRTVRARYVAVTPAQETKAIKAAAGNTPEFAYCDYSDLELGGDKDNAGVPLRDVLANRRRYTIEEAPPSETGEIEVEGYILRLPEELRAARIEAARAEADARESISATRVPRAIEGASEAASEPADQTQGASAQLSASAEMARKRALRGTQASYRAAIVDALIEAGSDGMAVREMQRRCAEAGHPEPSRGWVNKRLREWRNLDPDHPCDPPVVAQHPDGKGWVWTGSEPAEPEPVDAPSEPTGAPPPPRGWTPRVITNNEEDEHDDE